MNLDMATESNPCDDLADRLAAVLAQPIDYLPRRGIAPSMSYGRHTGPARHDARPAAVLLLLLQRDGGWTVPLTRRPDHLSQHPGQVSLPGGSVEPGENSAAAALREAEEELGIARDRVRLLGSLSRVYVFNSNFVLDPWIGVSAAPAEFHPDPCEVAEVIELPLPELNVLAEPALLGRTRIRRGELEFTAPCLNWQGATIWGATLVVLGQFVQRLKVAMSAIHNSSGT
jgi:8-oxo-dGTP pyrophosphatase MutT (NUDIX family)